MKSKKFEFIDITTADVGFLAYGRDLNELFENAALAMFESIVNTAKVERKVDRKVEVEGEDLESLMFNWLNELLFYVDAENLVFSEFDVRVDEKSLMVRAVCKGEKIDVEKHEVRTLVKSCTYHKLRVEKNEIWRAQVILDT